MSSSLEQQLQQKYDKLLNRIESLESKLECSKEGELIQRWTTIQVRVEKLESALGMNSHTQDKRKEATKISFNNKCVDFESQSDLKVMKSETERRLSKELISKGIKNFRFVHCPEDYYERDLEYRRKILNAPSIFHLCKSLVMENTKLHPEAKDCSNPKNSKYYLIICQYGGFPNWDKLHKFLHKLNEGNIAKKYFNLRLAGDGTSDELSGYSHNSVTPVCFKSPIPIILSEKIANLNPPVFYMGGGEVNLKLGVDVNEFVQAYHPFVVDFEKDTVAESS
eukprot:TRINITY_DN6551_c0_g2_i2.p1 TRINITY_DN6551_c0_g2~~TRINITY_DN6551_c0_g2_i2.p1  ORF type:complete len:280 (-),score=35.23 TRINITY_DN6551_c0_g2_i2:65-904(-)